MATEQVRPTADLTNTWGSPVWSKINDNVLQGNAGNGTTAGRTNSNSTEQQCTCGTPANSGTCTAITAWIRAQCSGGNGDDIDVTVRIRVNGTWNSVGIVTFTSDAGYAWLSVTLSGLNIAMSSVSPAIGMALGGMHNGDTFACDVAYLDMTYTAAGANVTEPQVDRRTAPRGMNRGMNRGFARSIPRRFLPVPAMALGV